MEKDVVKLRFMLEKMEGKKNKERTVGESDKSTERMGPVFYSSPLFFTQSIVKHTVFRVVGKQKIHDFSLRHPFNL